MSEQVKMSIGVSLVLAEVTKMLLYKTITDANGQKVIVDRDIPFKLRYRLNKNKAILDKDVEYFNQQRLLALAKYGEADENAEHVVIKNEEKEKLFKEEISKLVDSEIIRSLTLVSPEELELLEDTDMPISPEAMNIFINYLVDDPDLRKDPEYTFEINVHTNIPEKSKTPVVEEKPEVEKVEAVNVTTENNEVVAPVEEVVKPTVKKTKSKTSSEVKEVKSDAEKKPAVKKASTTKKTTTKKKVEK